jgi:hypothetical protein
MLQFYLMGVYNPPPIPPPEPKKTISQQILGWVVVGAIILFFLAGGLTFMTSGVPYHVLLADIFYCIAGVLFIWKFLTWEDAKQQDSHKRRDISAIAIGCTVVVLVVAVGGNHYLNRTIEAKSGETAQSGVSNPETPPPASPTKPPESGRDNVIAKDTPRVMARLTPLQLAQIYEQRTTVEANKLAEVHVGTWLPISGSVLDIWEVKGVNQEPWMTIVKVDGVAGVICSFRQEWYQRTAILQKGDQVKIIGKISHFDGYTIKLEECEITS